MSHYDASDLEDKRLTALAALGENAGQEDVVGADSDAIVEFLNENHHDEEGADENVKVTEDDASSGFLDDKIEAGNRLNATVRTLVGDHQDLKLDVDTSGLARTSGDLGGSDASPEVQGIRGRTVSSGSPNEGDGYRWTGNSFAPVGLFSALMGPTLYGDETVSPSTGRFFYRADDNGNTVRLRNPSFADDGQAHLVFTFSTTTFEYWGSASGGIRFEGSNHDSVSITTRKMVLCIFQKQTEQWVLGIVGGG